MFSTMVYGVYNDVVVCGVVVVEIDKDKILMSLMAMTALSHFLCVMTSYSVYCE